MTADVKIDYTNWKGIRSTRIICPIGLIFTSNEWHPEPQWMIEARDLEKNAIRTFPISKIHSWKEIK